MHLLLLALGKDHEEHVRKGTEEFTKRLQRYLKTEWKIIAPPRNAGSMEAAMQQKKEAELVMQQLLADDYLVALDEGGTMMSSGKLARFIQSRANESTRRMVFLIGGAYGLHESLLQRAKFRWSLSPLTFPHQLVRLILAEQLYRACTILRNEGYHHGS